MFLCRGANGHGLGAVLLQGVDGAERVAAHASRRLNDAETRRPLSELECQAIVWAVEKFQCHLYVFPFTVVSDSSILQ